MRKQKKSNVIKTTMVPPLRRGKGAGKKRRVGTWNMTYNEMMEHHRRQGGKALGDGGRKTHSWSKRRKRKKETFWEAFGRTLQGKENVG